MRTARPLARVWNDLPVLAGPRNDSADRSRTRPLNLRRDLRTTIDELLHERSMSSMAAGTEGE